jgi:hypothetical protein
MLDGPNEVSDNYFDLVIVQGYAGLPQPFVGEAMPISQIGWIWKSVPTTKLGKQSSPRQAVASML